MCSKVKRSRETQRDWDRIRRMKRLRVVACWGSVLLLAALAAAMLRSFLVADGFTWTAWDAATGTYHGRIIALRSGRGVVGMELMHVSTSLKPVDAPIQE